MNNSNGFKDKYNRNRQKYVLYKSHPKMLQEFIGKEILLKISAFTILRKSVRLSKSGGRGKKYALT